MTTQELIEVSKKLISASKSIRRMSIDCGFSTISSNQEAGNRTAYLEVITSDDMFIEKRYRGSTTILIHESKQLLGCLYCSYGEFMQFYGNNSSKQKVQENKKRIDELANVLHGIANQLDHFLSGEWEQR